MPEVIGYPARDEADELALFMLAALLREDGCWLRVLPARSPASEVLTEIGKHPPAVVCVGSVGEASLFGARRLCQRIRESRPEVRIVLGRWLASGENGPGHRFAEVANDMGNTLAETRAQVLRSRSRRPGEHGNGPEERAAPVELGLSRASIERSNP